MLKRISSLRLPSKPDPYIVLLFLVLWAALRLVAYGDPSLSIAGNDTPTFVEASRVSLFSAEMMTGRRLLTTNLIYKIMEPESGYQILVNGSLATSRRLLQPGFDRIVILQLILSILGWSALTWAVASNIKSRAPKILSAVIVPLFAYTPQIADWDSILMSESMTFSLFALQLAFLIQIAGILHENPNARIAPWMIAWGTAYFFWANLRDTNNYVAPVLFGMAGLTLLAPRYRKNKALMGAMAFAAILFVLGLTTFRQSGRSLISTINIYTDDIFPYPARVEYMKGLGMPDLAAPEFDAWFRERGLSSVTRFILAHPGYSLDKLVRDFPEAFKEIRQTYFHMPEMKLLRARLHALGEFLHPETAAPSLMSLLLMTGIVLAAVEGRHENARSWAWVSLFMFFAASIVMVPTILGDTWALNRHALFSTTLYRLMMWLFALVLMDLAISNRAPDTSPTPQNRT